MIRITTLSATLLVFGISCYAQDRQPLIINGQPTNAFAAVGIVGEASVGGFCTGTLITSTHVLTAAHCAEAILRLGDEDSGTFEVGRQVYRTTQVHIIPSFDADQFIHDVAVLVLSEPVLDIEPAELSAVPPNVGELVTIVGFGGQGTPEGGSDGSFGTKLVGQVVVDHVTANEFSWIFNDLSESNPAPGDSGGPVFIDGEQGLLLAGIVSSGTTADAALGDITFNMRVDAYEPWITEIVFSSLPPAEPPDDLPEPDGDPSDVPDDGDDDSGDSDGGESDACKRPPAGNRGKPHGHGPPHAHANHAPPYGHAFGHRRVGGPRPTRTAAKAKPPRGPASRYAPRRPPRGQQR